VNGVSVGLVPFEAPIGASAFAFELTYRLAGRPIPYVGDVVFRRGDLLGAVFVTATDRSSLRAWTRALARRLDARMRRVRDRPV
jgi:hypothetical protein